MRTEDVYRRASTWLLAAVACVLITVGGLSYLRPANTATLRMSQTTYILDVADTQETRTLGLSGRKIMAPDQGMVFVFTSPDEACFWMKDMRFSLDMIWLDSKQIVGHIERNVSPKSFPRSYCPPRQASYVIELNAGQAARNTIRVGDKLDLRLPQR